MAKLIKANGEVNEVTPQNGTDFSLEEMQKFVGGYIEIVNLSRKERMVLNEEGKMHNFPVNNKATMMTRGIVAYNDLIVGDVLVCDSKQIK